MPFGLSLGYHRQSRSSKSNDLDAGTVAPADIFISPAITVAETSSNTLPTTTAVPDSEQLSRKIFLAASNRSTASLSTPVSTSLETVNPFSKRTARKQTPLHLAVKFGHVGIAKSLITNAGVGEGLTDVNAQDQDGATALALAINIKNHALIQLLLTCPEVDLNKADEIGGYAPLVRAAWLEDEKTVQMLLSVPITHDAVQRKLNLNSTDNVGRTAFHWAVLRQNPGIINLLVEAGADINLRDDISNSTPLCSWSKQHVHLIHKVGNAQGHLPLAKAIVAVKESLKIGQQLCHLPSIDPHLPDANTSVNTPLGYLIIGVHRMPKGRLGSIRDLLLDTIKTFLSIKSLDINASLCTSTSLPPLVLCMNMSKDNYKDILEILLRHKPMAGSVPLNVNTLMLAGSPHTALSLATRTGNIEDVKLLFDSKGFQKFDFQAPYIYGKTCLQFALLRNHREMARMFIQGEGFANKTEVSLFMENNWEKLCKAAEESHEAVLEVCNKLKLEHDGSTLQHRTDNGALIQKHREAHELVRTVYQTALKAADDVEARKHMSFLDVNARDANGHSALHYAVAPYLLSVWTDDQNREPAIVEEPKKNEKPEKDEIPTLYAGMVTGLEKPQKVEEPKTVEELKKIDDQNKKRGTVEESKKVIRALLATPGIDLNPINDLGTTPLFHAISGKLDFNIFRMLLVQRGIDVNCGSNRTRFPICAVNKLTNSENARCWKALVVYKRTNLNLHMWDGTSILGYCARSSERLDLLRALLTEGERVQPNLRSKANGYTALCEAVAHGNYAGVNMLLICPGVDIDRPDNNLDTPLTIAARNGNVEIVRALLRKKPNLAWRNYLGLTPLDIAVEEGHAEIVELLEDAINKTTEFGNNPGSTNR